MIQICLYQKKTDLSAEFENILQWAADNLMTVNINKTKEIVFHRSSARHSLSIPIIIGIEKNVVCQVLPFVVT